MLDMTQRRLDRQHDRFMQAQFDAMTPADAAARLDADPISERMAIATTGEMRVNALSVVFTLSALLTDPEFDDTEMLPSEILDNLMLEAFSDDDDDDEDDGEIDATVKMTFSAHVSDALSTLGVEDSVIDDIFSNDVEVADVACTTAAETVLENMPDDGDDFINFIASFAYSDDSGDDLDDDSDEPMMDGMGKRKKLAVGKKTVKKVNGKTLVYKAIKAIRNGKKVTINKRISGKPLLKAAQKKALKKARIKASTAGAIRRQMRSFKKGARMNIHQNP